MLKRNSTDKDRKGTKYEILGKHIR